MAPKRQRAQKQNQHNHHDDADYGQQGRNTRHKPRVEQVVASDWPPPGAVQLGPYMLGAGKYWVGDLSTVLGDEDWKEIGGKQGAMTLRDGRQVVIFKLPSGGGVYPGKDGHNHLIDSGTIGLTRLKGLGHEATTMGQTTVYSKTFKCLSITVAHPQGGGMVSFNTFGGNIEVDSDDEAYTMTQFLREGVAAQRRQELRLRSRYV
ncbi:hypothetical protein T484DRAFT_1859613 [Baffinella frigidus]|nr:hypothetical protein T484DRAFT_1859613 [Cryptophyta sp. CCMP2293]